MSSLGDIQQIHSMLQQISKLLDEVDTKTDGVSRKSQTATEALRQLESVALRYLVIARRLGLPEQVDVGIQKIAMMIVALRQLEMTIIATQAAFAGAGPIGWLALGASWTYTALSFYSLGGQ